MNTPSAAVYAAGFCIELKSKGDWGIFTALLICWMSKHKDWIVKTTFLDLTVSPSLVLLVSCWSCKKTSAFICCRPEKCPETFPASRGYYCGNACSSSSRVSAVTSVLIYLEVSGGWESFLQLIKLHLSVSLELKVNFLWCLRSEVPAAQRLAGVPDVCSLAKWSMHQEVS